MDFDREDGGCTEKAIPRGSARPGSNDSVYWLWDIGLNPSTWVQLADSKALCRSSARKFMLGEVRLYPWCW